jgi:hypothetical protein
MVAFMTCRAVAHVVSCAQRRIARCWSALRGMCLSERANGLQFSDLPTEVELEFAGDSEAAFTGFCQPLERCRPS